MYGVKIKIFILTFCISSASSQACDSSSDVTQCSDGEICRRNVCESALYCGGVSNPCGVPCVSDYCQPNPCTVTGQCVHGHVCSQDRSRSCVFTDDVTIDSPDNYVTVGTSLTLTCTANRIKPLPLAMYWEINGRNELGMLTARDDDGDGVFTQRNDYVHRVTKEDEGNPIKCVVVPRFGQTITVEKILNLGYPPTGKPTIEVFPTEQYKGEKVTLTCVNPTEDGNPDCDIYVWTKQRGNISTLPENLPNTQVYTFIMDEFHEGNFSCKCRNVFGQSDDSDIVEIVNLGERPEIDSVAEHNGGLIAGCVIGVLVLVALVILGVIVFKRYKGKLNLKFKPRRERAENVSSVDNGGYEDPVNNNANPYEDVDNGENNVNQYQEVNNGANIGNQYNIINGGNNGNQYDVINGGNIGNQYDVINEAAMAMPRGAGFVNPGMTTYEEVL